MKYAKKSLGQNFLIDKNIIKKIINQINIKNKNVIEIGPGNGALTNEILNKKPLSLSVIEKDHNLVKNLKNKYIKSKLIKIYEADILKFDLEKIMHKNTIIFGNLPYNISSQILIKFLKFKKWPPKFNDLILMFQKELADKILGLFKTSNYGRISIISNYRLINFNNFLVSPNCFFPKPKVISKVIHFKPKKNIRFKIKNVSNLEKVTNILFSNKRKIIKKNLQKIINGEKISQLNNLKLTHRPSEIKPEIFYKITELYEQD